MPRFVILEHDHPFLHWDFMVECGEVLRSWRLDAKPQAGIAVLAEPLGDHRKVYLDYEGPVSGNRGQVKRWDAGTFDWEMDLPDRVAVRLQGQRCRATAILERTQEKWRFTLTS